MKTFSLDCSKFNEQLKPPHCTQKDFVQFHAPSQSSGFGQLDYRTVGLGNKYEISVCHKVFVWLLLSIFNGYDTEIILKFNR
jgi:hypothetical protein